MEKKAGDGGDVREPETERHKVNGSYEGGKSDYVGKPVCIRVGAVGWHLSLGVTFQLGILYCVERELYVTCNNHLLANAHRKLLGLMCSWIVLVAYSAGAWQHLGAQQSPVAIAPWNRLCSQYSWIAIFQTSAFFFSGGLFFFFPFLNDNFHLSLCAFITDLNCCYCLDFWPLFPPPFFFFNSWVALWWLIQSGYKRLSVVENSFQDHINRSLALCFIKVLAPVIT